MKRWRALLDNERGTALALAMIILVIMTALAIGLATMGGVEARISSSQSAATRARLLAESGIEYGLLKLSGGVGGSDFSSKLAAGTSLGSNERSLIASGTTLPGLSSAYGTFAVSIRNDINTGDNLLTAAGSGCLTCAMSETGNATSDTNGVIIITSTGTVDGATRTITAVVQRGVLPINAALTLPGVQTDTTTDSPCQNPACPPNPLRNYSIDGRDWRQADTTSPTGTATLKLGIATSLAPSNMETNVEAAFDDTYKRAFVQGRNETIVSPTLTTGLNTINGDGALTPEHIQKFMANLAANPATQIIMSTQACQFGAGSSPRDKPEGLRLTSTGTPNLVSVRNNCGGSSQINQTINLGTASNPQMLYFKGEFDPSSNFVGVGVEGSQPIQGYGILVVEDADMAFFQTGNFRWDGIVLVTGRNVSIAFKGNSNAEIRGSVIGSETNGSEPGGYFEFFNRTTGKMNIRASKENVDMALLGLYNMRVTSYREKCGTATTSWSSC
jgi:Tfp pilus assembly protein PilX